jgi:hypothetical protein
VPRCVVAIPVGPSAIEAERARDAIASARAHEPAVEAVVVVDDGGPGDRSFDGCVVLPNPRRGRGYGTLGGTCAATFTALAWARDHAPGAWVLRLDTDALVIGPFAAAVDAAFADDPHAGVLGSCHRTCNGEARDVSAWASEARRHARVVWTWRRLQLGPSRARALVQRALAAGYQPGTHCIAAGCAIAPGLIGAMDLDPEPWIRSRLGDDVLLGLAAAAHGFALRDLHAVFGLHHVGLPDAPQRLVDRGFAVVHSVKNDPAHAEADVRAFFAARRA